MLLRRANHNEKEANAIEAVLDQYFLFECARRVPIPPPASKSRKRKRRQNSSQPPPVRGTGVESQCTVLGLSPNDAQNPVVIERAFRRAAFSLHPDKLSHLSENEKEEKIAAFKAIVNARDDLIKKLKGDHDS